jgi:hypothetical protein
MGSSLYPGVPTPKGFGETGLTGFNEQKVAERTPIIQQNSINGFTSIRDRETETGGGTVTNNHKTTGAITRKGMV